MRTTSRTCFDRAIEPVVTGNSPTNATDPSGLIDPENHGSTEYPEVYHPKTVMLPPWWAEECWQCDDNLPASQSQQRLSIGALDTPPMTAERSKQYAIAEMEYQIRLAQQYGRSTALMQADLMKMRIRPSSPAPLLVAWGPQDAGYGLTWDVLNVVGAVGRGSNPIKTAAGANFPYRVGVPSNNPVATAPLNPGAPVSGLRDPNSIRFSQDSIKNTFSDGRSISELIYVLKSGWIRPGDFPAIRLVERGGHLITIDNRRLEACRRAGVEINTRMATPAEIAQAIRQGKFSAGPLGSPTIRVRGE